jgi:hypothetical protein
MNRRYSHLASIHLSLLLYLRFFIFFRVGKGILVRKNSVKYFVDSEHFPLFRRRKCSFERHSEVHGRVNSEACNGTIRNYVWRISFIKQQKYLDKMMCLYLKSCLFWLLFRNFGLPHFEKMIQNENFQFRQN